MIEVLERIQNTTTTLSVTIVVREEIVCYVAHDEYNDRTCTQ